jgi:prevent-host-death family protein
MKTVNIHEAKTHLSKLVDEASRGESFVIAKAGKPMVKVTAVSAPTGAQVRRLGFMEGQVSVPRLSGSSVAAYEPAADTHLLLLAAGHPDRLSADAHRLIDNAENELLFSAASLWGSHYQAWVGPG